MSSEYKARIDERESWLASMPDEPAGYPPEAGGGASRPQLLATAALVQGVVNQIDVPEEGQRRSLQRVRAVWAAREGDRPAERERGAGWGHTLSGVLGVVFRFGRKK